MPSASRPKVHARILSNLRMGWLPTVVANPMTCVGENASLLVSQVPDHGLGQRLLGVPVALPGVLALLCDAIRHGVQVEMRTADVVVDLVPGDGSRHADARPPARRERGHRGGAEAVA